MRSPIEDMTEKELDFEVMKLAMMFNWLSYHTHDSRRSAAGFPDRVLVRPPRIVYAELKTEKEKPSPEQMGWLETLARCPGNEVFLWRPSDLEEIATVLR